MILIKGTIPTLALGYEQPQPPFIVGMFSPRRPAHSIIEKPEQGQLGKKGGGS